MNQGKIDQANTPGMKKDVLNQEDLNRISAINTYGGRHLQNFKHENRTYDVCLAAVTKDGSAIEFVPIEFLTKEMYAAACKSDGMVLKLVPEKYISASLCKDAVSSKGGALQYVPEKYKTVQLCQIALKSYHSALAYIPEEMITPEFCAKALKGKKGDWVSSIPEKCRSAEFFEELVKLEPNVFWHTTKKYRTIAFCKNYLKSMKFKSAAEAIRKNEEHIGLLNPGLYDHDTCLAIVQSNCFLRASIKTTNTNHIELLAGGSIQINKLLQDSDVCIQAVGKHADLIKYVPNKFITPEFLKQAMDMNRNVFMCCPEQYKTKEICDYAYQKSYHALDDMPDSMKTAEMCLDAVRHSGFLLRAVPDHLKTTEMCKIAVADEGKGTRYVPERLYDKELAELVLKNPGSIMYPLNVIPKQFLDYEMYKYAVSKEGRSLREVPKEFVDYEMCLTAVKNNPRAAEFVPLEFFSSEIAEEATKRSDCFEFIPEEKMTEEILLKIAVQSPSQLPALFPERLRTEELFQKIVEACPDAGYYIKRLK